ncbi:hypothetical protein B0T10DRAFT_555325 [Thelonectria olida]|uniref:Hypervirulence associated protein TUDOR domain-containing protein n=1 Tax=Thelonectria olida TaxID=1576542 RepID=A0A9P9B014_9HYPO|nr:hypothetical protein B0T10DRAFT_555325 [Thelonectria olida]
MVQYEEGQKVRYKPVGGPDSNTSESTGTITGVLTEPGVQAERNVQANRKFQYREGYRSLRSEYPWSG